MKRLLCIPFALLPFAGACTIVYHQESALPPDQLISDDRLLGCWEAPGESAGILVEPGPGLEVLVTPFGEWAEEGDAGAITLRLGTLNGRRVLEVTEHAEGTRGGDDLGPAERRFLLVLAELDAETLAFHPPNWNALAAIVQAEGSGIAYERSGEDLVLTEPTERLIRLYGEFLARPDGVNETDGPMVLVRAGAGCPPG